MNYSLVVLRRRGINGVVKGALGGAYIHGRDKEVWGISYSTVVVYA